MDEYKNIEFKDIDIEDDEEGETLVQKYQIRSVPTTLLLDENNEVIYKVMGNVTEKDFIMFINKALEKENEEK
jgi:thioredoxin-related protein